MDIREAAAANPTRPMTHLQSRIEQEMSMRMERRGEGGPHDAPEIDREITMVQGALHGVEQRLGELVAKLQPVMHPKEYAALVSGGDHVMRPDTDDLAPMTEYGQRIREIQYAVTGIEHALSYLGQGVRT